MKILVLSDSHSSMRFMYSCMEAVKPDAVIHLGDYYDDGASLHEDYPDVRFYQVPGNCDAFRCPPGVPEILSERVLGVDLYMTHGHRHHVKQYLWGSQGCPPAGLRRCCMGTPILQTATRKRTDCGC